MNKWNGKSGVSVAWVTQESPLVRCWHRLPPPHLGVACTAFFFQQTRSPDTPEVPKFSRELNLAACFWVGGL